jgi:biotin carboxylase
MKHIGVVESNLAGSGFQGIKIAKELGCHVTFFTSGMDRYLAVPGGGQVFDNYVDDIEFCQTSDVKPLLRRVCEVARRHPFSALLSMAEYEVAIAAEAANALGLPTADPASVRTARNKIFMRRRCVDHGVPMPAFRAVATRAEAVRAAHEVGLPCVVKPADETSSADVRRCGSDAEVLEQFDIIRSKPFNVRGQPRHPEILVEECLHGFEVSVEMLASGDGHHVLGVTDKTVGGNNRFVELGHLFPSQLPQAIRTACADVAERALSAVGFDLGLAHIEVKYTGDGPKLIEINPRPAGDRITELLDLSLDSSCLELVLRQHLGEYVGGDLARTAVRGAAIRFLTADPGRVVEITGTQVAAKMTGVHDVVVSPALGDAVFPLRRNEDRVGHVVAVAENSYVASRIAEAAAAEITVSTIPHGASNEVLK